MNGIGIGEEEKKRREIKIHLREDDDEKGWRRLGSRPCAIEPAIKLSIESREGKKGEERRREYRDDENTKDERRKEEEPWRRGRPRATEKSCASGALRTRGGVGRVQ